MNENYQHTRFFIMIILTMIHAYSSFKQFRSIRPIHALYSSTFREGVGFAKGSLNVKGRYRLEHETLSGLPDISKPFLVLGIESSCDDTGVAVVRSDGTILSNVVYSQQSIHENFGGVVPGLAMEAHKDNIDVAVKEAIEKAGLTSVADVDSIAVTKGPGLEICLRVGCRKAQSLAREFNKPFVTVHHLEAHCLIARLAGMQITSDTAANSSSTSSSSSSHLNELLPFTPKVDYPFLVLLASGGHTSLLICKNIGEYEMLGGTLDDALGEAFDKAARLLGLKVTSSGGAAVEQMAKLYVEKYQNQGNNNTTNFLHQMRVPLRTRAGYDFSYAGLKNAFRVDVQKARAKYGLDTTSTNAPAGQLQTSTEIVTLPEDITAYLCYAFQDVAFTHIEDRIKRAIQYMKRDESLQSIHSLVVVGGVASNMELRRRLLLLLKKLYDKDVEENYEDAVIIHPWTLIFPPVKLCTDNGVMVAWAGIEKLQLGISNAIEGQEVIARWPLGHPITQQQQS